MKKITAWAHPCLEAMEKLSHAQHTRINRDKRNDVAHLKHGYMRNATADKQNKSTSFINIAKGGCAEW